MITSLSKIRDDFKKKNLDAILITSVPNIVYLTGYSGFSKEEREAYIILVAQPQRLTLKTSEVLRYILTDGRYSEIVRQLIPDFKLIEISSKNPLKKVLKNLKEKHKIKKLGIEENNLSAAEYKEIKKHFDNTYPYSVNKFRMIKTKEEISKIEKACKLGDKTFDYILKKIKLGISEKEIATEIEFFIKRNGADISFKPIVAFGKNSAFPHHVPTNLKLIKNQIVLLDFGVKLNNYCSDMTRTIFFGKATQEFKKMYRTVLNAQQKSLEILNAKYLIHNTIAAKEIDSAARKYIILKGYKTIPHSLGHGIGIEVHESPHLSPKSKDILKEGMVFSIEPGIYLPNFGGIRIEDLVVLEKDGPRLLSHSPKNLIEI